MPCLFECLIVSAAVSFVCAELSSDWLALETVSCSLPDTLHGMPHLHDSTARFKTEAEATEKRMKELAQEQQVAIGVGVKMEILGGGGVRGSGGGGQGLDSGERRRRRKDSFPSELAK